MSVFDAAIDGLVSEVIVADCGSTDATLRIAEDAGATVVKAASGRQLLAGARAARKPWLLFLKADAAMEKGWEEEAWAFIAKGETAAGAFRLRFAGSGAVPRLREAAAAIRTRLSGPRGCNALLIPVQLLDDAGAACPQAPDEGDLLHRLCCNRVVKLRSAVIANTAG
jgi:glycosyltransferase involved in cell wall biosynthesis